MAVFAQVPVGSYSTPDADGVTPTNTRSGVAPCVAGEFCVSGIRQPCPGGTYSSSQGQVACNTCPQGEAVCILLLLCSLLLL